jgi:hypothetical protein
MVRKGERHRPWTTLEVVSAYTDKRRRGGGADREREKVQVKVGVLKSLSVYGSTVHSKNPVVHGLKGLKIIEK